jgi:hypothetical protein
MIRWHRHSERFAAGATALLLQATLFWALSERQPSPSSGARGPSLTARILTATRPNRELPPPRLHAAPRMLNPVIELPAVPSITSAEPRRQVPRPSVDWNAAIQREVGAELSKADVPPGVRFGFPKMPAAKDPPPAFAWDERHINRVQRLEHGIIDLGPCTITLSFPIPVCHFGKDSGDGDLLGPMRDPRPGEPGPLLL